MRMLITLFLLIPNRKLPKCQRVRLEWNTHSNTNEQLYTMDTYTKIEKEVNTKD